MCTGFVGPAGLDELCALEDADDEDEDCPLEDGPDPLPLLVDEQAARTTPAMANSETNRPPRTLRVTWWVDITGPG
jgi:hypothetical protein